ncbi:glycosyl hydrolase [Amylocarpus encephaloides]|uniref:Glycosyl hydrolase n=1 Tax=Amylocarpus encephaloides TaxID=45428 RepID=A0A9P7YI08_9HELO|nr:glycosyl hydrolase [Amylocarpus encephaloides]
MKVFPVLSLALLAIPIFGQQYTNPVLWEDLADIDIFRVGDAFYYSASTMHYSPGAPILRSYDLVNWEYIGHSVPKLDFGSRFDLIDGSAYVKGIWASTMRYRARNGLYYWIGCIQGRSTFVFTAPSITGPWEKSSVISTCYYDAGLLVDDDDTMYVAYGQTTISSVETKSVFTSPSSIGTLEGSRMYKIKGAHYIFVTRPANGQYVLRSTNGPFGPYTIKQVLLNVPTPISGGGVPHQGGLVETQKGFWYYMAFVDSYPGGRVPVLAPITWGSDGFPILTTVKGSWNASYDFPLPPRPTKAHTGIETFSGTSLGPEWEWNHNPDTSKFTVNNGLTLSTATITSDLYKARNTLTHRILGPTSSGTIVMDYSQMKDGDRAGLALLRDSSAWIGIIATSTAFRISFFSKLTMTSTWSTSNPGGEITSAPIEGGKVWLRVYADIRPGTGRKGEFYYSVDGEEFKMLGMLVLNSDWRFFMGYRFAVFNYATKGLGGVVRMSEFGVDAPGLKTTVA